MNPTRVYIIDPDREAYTRARQRWVLFTILLGY